MVSLLRARRGGRQRLVQDLPASRRWVWRLRAGTLRPRVNHRDDRARDPTAFDGHWWHRDRFEIPAGLCVAVLWARRGKRATWRGLGTLLAIAIAFTLVVWVLLEWDAAANQTSAEWWPLALVSVAAPRVGAGAERARAFTSRATERSRRRCTGSRLPVFAEAWAPNIVFVLVACGLLLRGLRNEGRLTTQAQTERPRRSGDVAARE